MQKSTFKGGIHVPGNKDITNSMETLPAVIPNRVFIPLAQHIGKPSLLLVSVGDEVRKGQKIGDSQGFVSVPIHASVSGKVVALEKKALPGGNYAQCIVIENDGQEQWAETVKPHPNPASLSPDELRNIIQEAGIVGLGGATFPSHVKYAPVEGKSAEFIILNGIECEPFLTSDHRIMMEKPDRIVAGLKYIMKATNCPQGIIAIEDNKMDAVEVLKKAASEYSDIEVLAVNEKYPQGSEKQLIYACTGREVPPGKLPLDVGVVVNNVGTAAAVADAVELGKPLIERIVTVNGDGVKSPANYLVRTGTLFKELIEQSGGYTGEIAKIIAGGPMMGKTVFTDDIPCIKGTSGILVFKKGSVKEDTQESTCVRCGKCVDACPIFLEPTTLVKLIKKDRWEEAENNDVLSCIECGSCTFVCPAYIPLVQYIRRAKQVVAAAQRARAKK